MNEIHREELRIFAVSPLSLAARTQKMLIHLHTHTLDPPKPNYGEANGCFVFLLCGFLHRDKHNLNPHVNGVNGHPEQHETQRSES